jgi:type II secretory ATPase GspE/PulE/Tfp pilus assembly ATPase PilB-like protein
MTEQAPDSGSEQRRRSAAALFLKVHDLDEAAAAGIASPPVVRLCDLMIHESLQADGDQLRVLAPTGGGATIQLHRDGAWTDIMRVPAAVQVPLINRLKVMANLDIGRQPLQQGVVKVRIEGEVLTLGIEVKLRGDAEEALLQLPPRSGEPESQEAETAT